MSRSKLISRDRTGAASPRKHSLLPALLGCAWALGATAAEAQTVPDAGSLLRDLQGGAKPRGEAPLAQPPVAQPEAPLPQKSGATVRVSQFHIVATAFPEALLQEQVKDFVGRALGLADLEEAARRITGYYRAHDLLARAYLPRQTIKDGVVQIVVLEGRLGQIKVDPASKSRLDADLATSLVGERAPSGKPLHLSTLEEGVAILNELPGVSAKATLAPGSASGESDALLTIEDRSLVTGAVQADNAGSRWIGEQRLFGTVAVNDLLGRGDQATATALKTANSRYGRVALAAPVGYSGLTVGVNSSRLDFDLDKALSAVSGRGSAWTAGATAAYPLLRGAATAATATLSYDRKGLVNQANGADTSNRSVDVVNLGVVASLADGLLGGGVNQLGAGVALGAVGLAASADGKAADALGPHTAGSYSKGLLSAARSQPLCDAVELYLSLSGQLAGKNLDSSEKFSLGGPSGVRAYPVNEGNGDDGALGTAEMRYRVIDGVRLIGFYDAGWVRQYHTTWSGWQPVAGEPNAYVLQGAGGGVSWAPLSMLEVKATVAHSIGVNPGHDANGDNSDGKKRGTRLWLGATATF